MRIQERDEEVRLNLSKVESDNLKRSVHILDRMVSLIDPYLTEDAIIAVGRLKNLKAELEGITAGSGVPLGNKDEEPEWDYIPFMGEVLPEDW
jgi:hypothetical protein